MNVTENRDLLFKAIAAAQGEFTTVDKSASNPHFKSKFAPLDSIIEMIRPILPKHGLSVVQFTDIPESGNGVIIETIITHDSGQYISGRLFMPTVKQDPQGYGSSITYGRRYALGAALGIVSDEDVDGNQAEGTERQTRAQQKSQEGGTGAEGTQSADIITPNQVKMLHAKIKAMGADAAAFVEHFGIKQIELLPKAKMNDALKFINGK
jgi:hypothetical protein